MIKINRKTQNRERGSEVIVLSMSHSNCILSDIWSNYSMHWTLHHGRNVCLHVILQSHSGSGLSNTVAVLYCIHCNSIIPCKAQLIQLYEYIEADGNLILYCNMLVITCIIFSIPLAQYPARSSIWNLLYTALPTRMPMVSSSIRIIHDYPQL